MYVDPYIRMSQNRHWLANNAEKKSKRTQGKGNLPQTMTATTTTYVKKTRYTQEEKFNPEVLDTFCFHWPDMHSYVLVRVLDSSIAILPVRSRLAFLYFHHAPLPTHPSPKELRKALRPVMAANSSSRRIHDMFKSWKHTLAIEDGEKEEQQQEEGENLFSNKSDSSSVDNNTSKTSITSISNNKATETPPSTPKICSNVTLADVLSYERDLRNGWIHAPCIVTDDKSMFDNNVILTTKHTVIRLTTRCFSEKMMFMNLVKLQHGFMENHTLDDKKKHNNNTDIDDNYNITPPPTRRSSLKSASTTFGIMGVSSSVIESLERKTEQQMEEIHRLMSIINTCKKDIASYTRQLLELDQSLDTAMDTTLNIQFGSLKHLLDYVNNQLADSITQYNSDRSRITQLQEQVSVHNAFLKGALQRYEQIKRRVRGHAFYPWLYTGN
ncbi:hypothetical protein [Parasitella parasitica]|uniref:Uncharacterized protein n=1 Tax=Parasitella parasitica TaxID=35722 RepID=A0A0B7MSY2_9FUNG|nr:hypothetical protein [Parasitella parasitica]